MIDNPSYNLSESTPPPPIGLSLSLRTGLNFTPLFLFFLFFVLSLLISFPFHHPLNFLFFSDQNVILLNSRLVYSTLVSLPLRTHDALLLRVGPLPENPLATSSVVTLLLLPPTTTCQKSRSRSIDFRSGFSLWEYSDLLLGFFLLHGQRKRKEKKSASAIYAHTRLSRRLLLAQQDKTI